MLARLLPFLEAVWDRCVGAVTDLRTRDCKSPRPEASRLPTERVMKRAAPEPALSGCNQTLPHLPCLGASAVPLPANKCRAPSDLASFLRSNNSKTGLPQKKSCLGKNWSLSSAVLLAGFWHLPAFLTSELHRLVLWKTLVCCNFFGM